MRPELLNDPIFGSALASSPCLRMRLPHSDSRSYAAWGTLEEQVTLSLSPAAVWAVARS